MLMPPAPSEQFPPHRPALWQRGWLRWPLAWSLATLITLGMLAALAMSSRPRERTPAPERLAVALHALVPEIPPVPARPVTSPKPGIRPATANPSPRPEVLTAQPGQFEMPAPKAAPDGPLEAATPERPATQPSSGISGENPLATQLSGLAAVAELPLRQRCPHQVQPIFPRRASEDDISQGRVLARLLLEADGRVRSVQILDASPRGYFEAEASKAALQWRCLPSSQAGDSVRVPFVFRLE